MSEENLSQEGEVVENTETQTETQLSPVEQKALDMGWRPKEEWEGDEAEFISAETFVARKPLFDRIEHQNKRIKELDRALSALQEHHLKVKEVAYKDALETLKQEKRDALVEGDADKVIELDDKIAELRSQKDIEVRQVAAPSQVVNEDFALWVKDNSWYMDNSKKELREFADTAGLLVAQKNPGYSASQILKEVEKQVKKVFKEHFTNDRKNQPSAVDGPSSRSSQKSSKNVEDSLTEDERRVMQRFIRTGVMTKEEYLRDLKTIKEKE